MKKIYLLLILLLNIIILTGCNDDSQSFSGYNSMMNLYYDEGEITCHINSSDSTFNSIMYVAGKKSYIEEHFYMKDKLNHLYILSIDGKTYYRGDPYGEGSGIIKSTELTSDLLKSLKVEDGLFSFECTSGIEGEKFEIPSDISFAYHSNYN